MADQLQLRGGTTSEHATFTGALREVTVDTDKDTVVVHDNATVGGNPLMREDASNSALALGSAATPSLKFTGDLNTGIYSPGADQVSIATNGVERVKFGTSEVVFNDGNNDYDFRVESDNNASLLFVDASTDRFGIGHSSPATLIHVADTLAGSPVIARIENFSASANSDAALDLKTPNETYTLKALRSSARFDFEIGGTPKLSITAGGLVGIGTSAPSNLLTLNAPNANALTLFVGVNTGEYSSIRGKYGAGNDFAQSEIRFINADNPNGRGALAFAVGTNSTTEHMRITYDGKVGIGTTSPNGTLTVEASSGRLLTFRNPTTGTGASDGSYIGLGGSDLQISNAESASTIFYTADTERARIDSSGRLLVGTSTAFSTSSNALIQAVNTSGGEIVIGRDFALGSDSTIGRLAFFTKPSAVAEAARIEAVADAVHSGGAPTRLGFSTTASGASTPTERMRITSDGNVLVGKTSSSFGVGDGTVIGGAGYLAQTRTSATPFTVIRNGTDGTLVSFEAQNVEEGTISVSGTTVSYNGAHLSRWSQLPSGAERTEILRGSVLSNLDEMCEWIDPPTEAVLWEEGDELPEGVNVGDIKEPANPGGPQSNEQLNRMKVSDVEGDKNVSGVFQAWDDDDDTYTNDFYCAMTGDFIIRIAEGVIVERGDLLMSAGDGTAKPQNDDIIRSKTIAKVTSTNVSCTYEDGSYCVPCVLMAC
jgi:hypothetical protein